MATSRMPTISTAPVEECSCWRARRSGPVSSPAISARSTRAASWAKRFRGRTAASRVLRNSSSTHARGPRSCSGSSPSTERTASRCCMENPVWPHAKQKPNTMGLAPPVCDPSRPARATTHKPTTCTQPAPQPHQVRVLCDQAILNRDTDWRRSSAIRESSRTCCAVARVPSPVCSVTAKMCWMLPATSFARSASCEVDEEIC